VLLTSRASIPALSLALVVLTSAFLSGCVTSSQVPLEEYTLARAAYEAAKDADALRYAPALWYNAEENYREAQRAFKERNYGRAESLFEDARIAAEKAENAARIARHQAGDS
jgi:Domain of unknown function (DUF4398)